MIKFESNIYKVFERINFLDKQITHRGRDMHVLIIGAKGFIGSNLREYMKSLNYKVKAADIQVDYKEKDYYLVDSTNANFEDLFSREPFDLCVNCSGAASVPASLANPLRDFSLNSNNVFKILEAIRKYRPSCKFINLSSAAVYGNPTSLPINEKDSLAPLSPYGYHKRFSELICEEFCQYFGLKVASLRVFSAYGEGLRKQLFWDLHLKAKSATQINLYGTGKESRDFIYIRDLVRLIELVARKSKFDGDIINAAGGKEITIQEASECFFSIWKPSVQINFTGEHRKGDPSRWVSNIKKAESLGYCPEYTLGEGLQNYCEWLRREER